MSKSLYGLLLLFLLFLPLIALGQEDTCVIPSLYGTSPQLYLNRIIAQDTAGTGWQGANGITAWQNRTRVYVLQMNGYYPTDLAMNIGANRKYHIRAEYNVPVVPGSVYKPLITFWPTTTGNPAGNLVNCNGVGDTVILSNIMVTGYKEEDPGKITGLQGSIIACAAAATASIYIDSCIIKSTNGNHLRTDGRAYTVRITNSIFADMGSEHNSNFGAGKAYDARNVEVDTIDMTNNTFVNWQDRIIRHYQSVKPIHNLFFNHNTLVNGISYHGLLSLGWCDSTGAGTFQIKNNLLIDPCVFGPDTDVARQAEFIESGELDPLNAKARVVWVISTPNANIHWDISNNYYAISDSGQVVRGDLGDPYISCVQREEPYLTWGMNARLAALGGDTVNCFKKVTDITLEQIPPVMSEMARWYRLPRDANYWGAGKLKVGGSGVGDPQFTHWTIADPFSNPMDYHRHDAYWYHDSLDCSYSSADLIVSSDAQIVGDPRWSFTLIPVVNFAVDPTSIDFGTIAKNTGKLDSVVVTASGNSPLVISSVTSSAGEFVVSPTSATIQAGENAKFYITYTPTTPGAKSGNIVFVHNGTTQQQDTVTVSGGVVEAAGFELSAESIAFGNVTGGTSKTDSVTVTNHGTIALNITSVTSSNAVFTVTPTTANVDVEASAKFYIAFAPTANGAQTANIVFAHNALSASDTVAVSGTGTGVGVENLEAALPEVYQLRNNYPNPFNPSTTILYDLPKQSNVVLKVYSMLGQEVATLVNGVVEAGYQQVVWNGKYDDGRQVASGVYLFRMFAQPTSKGEAFTQVKKMLMLK